MSHSNWLSAVEIDLPLSSPSGGGIGGANDGPFFDHYVIVQRFVFD